MRAFVKTVVLGCLAAVFFTEVMAQDVTLSSPDGAVAVEGNLLTYDGQFYRVDTIYGVLTVDGSGVICAGPGCPDLEAHVAQLLIGGDTTVGVSLLPALLEGFSAQEGLTATQIGEGISFQYLLSDTATNAQIARVQFDLSTSSAGFEALIDGQAELILSNREVTPNENERAQAEGVGDLDDPRRSRVLALDALVPIVAEDNHQEEISVADLRRIHAGAVDNWDDVGGGDLPLSLHVLAPEQREGLQFASVRADDVEVHANSRDLVARVARDPLALGLGRLSQVAGGRILRLTGSCGFSFAPDQSAVKSEDYPFVAPYYVYTPGYRLPRFARDFLKYLDSEDAQQVVSEAGFGDQRLTEIPLSRQGDRFANAIAQAGDEIELEELQRMVGYLTGARRLSLTFRFRRGSTDLDAQSRANARVLAQYMDAGRFDGVELAFVGFSDGEGPADGNRRIALRRANAVQNGVLDLLETTDRSRLDLGVEAFGEALPMACDDSDLGRQINRRVELWVRPLQR
ncbi:phosphate ABC transporter substrate-binding/OmpA family protein [Cochlodiniinecator piscidefendens]|uniref:phosphate ABC transporter substrate-binding/OmpA family protein n=1 Tax=Cochlodiniinecator piscidefendens TaxID=2715756 RepID=UPI00140D10F7|nr:phosphate ABC transporter substrate-binding/OmpA family protein [Cochlodiniinecator piscidefendens]